MRYLISILFIFFATPIFAAELSLSNAGFVQSNIWYSKDPFYTGDKVRIYTVIFNGSVYDLTGSVEFLDNGTSLGRTNFSLSGSGRAQDLWIDWKAIGGSHTITAQLVNVFADTPNGKQPVSLPNIETGKSSRVVDIDPALKEAQTKADAQKVVEVGAQTLGKVGSALQAVGDVIPVPIKDEVSAGANAVEQFRIGEGIQLSLAKEKKSQEIAVIAARTKITDAHAGSTKKGTIVLDTVSNTTEKPFAYVILAILSVLQFIFEWKVLFYGIILYVLYRAVKWIIYKIRNR